MASRLEYEVSARFWEKLEQQSDLARALDRLSAIMDTGEARDQIRAAALTIETVLRLQRLAEREARRSAQLTRNEVRCILLNQKAEKSRKKQRAVQSRAA